MSYDISLHRIPKHINVNNYSEDELHEVVYHGEYEDYLICDTNISRGNPCAVGFYEVFGIIISDDDHYEVINKSDYLKFVTRLNNSTLDDYCKERVVRFLEHMEEHFKVEEYLFIYSG